MTKNVICILSLSTIFLGCDPEGKKDCAWVLEPEPDSKTPIDAGFIPVCARNRTTMKQDCRLQATLDDAKKFYGKKFRYVDMRVKDPGLPRTIQHIKFCE